MPELRWALIGLGALFLAGLALWEWRRNRRRPAQLAPELAVPAGSGSEAVRRIEPRIDDMLPHVAGPPPERATLRDVPVIHPTEPVAVPVVRETAVDLPAAARMMPSVMPEAARPATDSLATSSASRRRPPAIRWPPQRADRVLTLRLVNPRGAQLAGRELRLALEQAGFVPGPQCIYHRIDATGAVLASAANMLHPGDLDPQHIDQQQLRGLSLFCVLPGCLPPVRMLEELVAVARSVALRLSAVVQDEHGAELDGERLVKLRQSLPEVTEDGAG